MSEEDRKLQKHLVDEMMKVSETNPDVMFYMKALMKKYEELEQKVEQLENMRKEAVDYMKEFIFEPLLINEDRKLIMFNENLKNFENILNKGE